MLHFHLDLRVRERIKAKCPRHPKFDPSVDEKANSEARCSTCSDIRNLQSARITLETAARAFERRAAQWRVAQISKQRRSASVTDMPSTRLRE